MIVFVASCLIAVVISFLCSLLEATLLSLDDVHLESRRRQGSRYADVWLNLKKRIDRPIAAILILNTVAHTGGATVAGSSFDELFGDEWIWVFSVVFTLVILLGTEILPKVIGVSHAERLAPILARPLAGMTWALSPIIAITEWVSAPFRKDKGRRSFSIADLRTMADMARSERLIGKEQEDIIINATRLRTTTVETVMVPLDRIVFFDLNRSNIENFAGAASTLHTRYPVTADGSLDRILGYVNFKEVVAMMPNRQQMRLEPFIRPLSRVSAEASLNDALKTLLTRREHMVLVESADHRIVGLLTQEDLLEEIVGDLPDEFDQLPREILEVSPSRWKVGGGALIRELAAEIPLLEMQAEEGWTLDQWLHDQLGQELRVGDVVRQPRALMTVIQTRRRKAYRVLIEPVEGGGSPP